eukprot:scpid83175/ scgid8079/ 
MCIASLLPSRTWHLHTVRKLLAMLNNPQIRALVQLETAAVIDAGKVVVKATYNLEGDGPRAPVAYEIVRGVHVSLQSAHFPSLSALCAWLPPNDVNRQQQLKAHRFRCVQPGIDHFMKKFVSTAEVPAQFRQQVDAFKTASFFTPVCIADQKPTPEVFVDAVGRIPAISEGANAIGPEAPLHAAAVAEISSSVQPFAWWRRHADKLPHLSKAVRFHCPVLQVRESIIIAEQPLPESPRVFTRGDYRGNPHGSK